MSYKKSRAWEHALDIGEARGGLFTRSVRVGKRRTSVRLDEVTWRCLNDIAQREGVTVADLFTAIEADKPATVSLTAAIRIAVDYIAAATDARDAGHGGTVH